MSAISQISCSNIVIAECRDYLQGRERESRERQGLLPVSATGAACQLSVASDHVTGVKSPAIHLLRMKLALEFVLLLVAGLLLLLLLLTARAQWQNLKSEIWFTSFSHRRLPLCFHCQCHYYVLGSPWQMLEKMQPGLGLISPSVFLRPVDGRRLHDTNTYTHSHTHTHIYQRTHAWIEVRE